MAPGPDQKDRVARQGVWIEGSVCNDGYDCLGFLPANRAREAPLSRRRNVRVASHKVRGVAPERPR